LKKIEEFENKAVISSFERPKKEPKPEEKPKPEPEEKKPEE